MSQYTSDIDIDAYLDKELNQIALKSRIRSRPGKVNNRLQRAKIESDINHHLRTKYDEKEIVGS